MGIYFDNAATTQVRQEAIDIMEPFWARAYGNPSSIYSLASDSKKAVDTAREEIAVIMNAKADEIYFTSGGTEADNWAIKGVATALKAKGRHIITTQVEHHGVLHTVEYLEKKHKFTVTYLPVDAYGRVSVADLEQAIQRDTILISIMFANNEVGTIMPIKEIGEIAKKHGIYFHTDAVQAFGHIPIDVEDMNIDLLSISAHKIYGPKGVGALYIRKGIQIDNLFHGGAQEKNRRAGTENVPGIAAFGVCATQGIAEMDSEIKRQADMRNRLEKGLLEKIPFSFINGDPVHRLPNHLNIGFEFIEGEGILLSLNKLGIFTSSGSACTSASLDASHVLLAMGIPHERAHGTLRLSLGRYNEESDIDRIIDVLPPIIKRLRQMSPLYDAALEKSSVN